MKRTRGECGRAVPKANARQTSDDIAFDMQRLRMTSLMVRSLMFGCERISEISPQSGVKNVSWTLVIGRPCICSEITYGGLGKCSRQYGPPRGQ